MAEAVQEIYGNALFSLILEESSEQLKSVLDEIKTINEILLVSPDFLRLMTAPTISLEEKTGIISTTFKGKVNEYLFNFLCILVKNKRLNVFPQIYAYFKTLYNEHFNIAEITVITSMPLPADTEQAIKKKMEEYTKKTVIMTKLVDKDIMGGVVVDYGDTRLDGSVKTRLQSLKDDISHIIL